MNNRCFERLQNFFDQSIKMGAAKSQTQSKVQKCRVGGFNYHLCQNHQDQLLDQNCVDILIYICTCKSCEEEFNVAHLQMKLCSNCSKSRRFRDSCAACSLN